MTMSTAHRASALKQQNKKHNVLGHRSKGTLTKVNKGRVSVKTLSKKPNKQLSKLERRNQTKQIRSEKREQTVARKRSLGINGNPPFLVTVVPLSPNINPRTTLKALTVCDPTSTTRVSPQGVTHVSSTRIKQRFSFVIPPVNDVYAILDSIKVSDTVLFIWPGDEELGDAAEFLLSCVLSQGLPVPVHVISSLDDLSNKDEPNTSHKAAMETETLEEELSNRLTLSHQPSTSKQHHKKIRAKQTTMREIDLRFPGVNKLHCLEREQDAVLVLRQIGAQKQRPVFFRDNRPHVMAEKVEFVGEGSTGTLKVYGYLRGKPLSPNGLIHVPGWGDYQMSQISITGDPYPIERNKTMRELIGTDEFLFEEADPELQESLIATNEVDPMEGEQTWPTEEELREANSRLSGKTRTKMVPKGTSTYQAAWILDDDEEDKEGSADEDSDFGDEESDDGMAPVDVMSQDGEMNEYDDDDDDDNGDEYESMTVTDAGDLHYDEKVDYKEEMDAFKKMTAARDDVAYPDEIDTPQDIEARIRFQKYRGLQSFRTSNWDYNENLPVDYSRIFQFRNFQHSKKRILNEEREGALPGWYVILHIKDVPQHLYRDQVKSQSPFVFFGLLPHEQKMSAVNIVIKSHSSGHFRAIKSKERLIFQIGFRRYANQPIFSEHTVGNKHKFARYFHPGSTVVATMFAPITFPPAPVMMFRERPDGAQDLVATGSVLNVDPKRMIIKRVILSGYPLKINKKSAVVRFMFFNREDVHWFKPVELRTKWGRRGHIKEPLGTHGHMKVHFDGQMKSQDSVLMNLYKRMFPKWTFDPHVARPPPLYSFRSIHDDASDESSEDEVQQPPIDCPPNKKKAKKVGFVSSR